MKEIELLNEIVNSAKLKETDTYSIKKKKKQISYPVAWEALIKENYEGTINQFIKDAIKKSLIEKGLL